MRSGFNCYVGTAALCCPEKRRIMKKPSGKWITEPYKGTLLGFTMRKKIYDKRSKFQRIEVYETLRNGKILLLDGCFMLTEKEEFVYHEMIAHVPLFAHPNPKRVLVIGGGDGGTVREVLKHKCVKSVDFVEIDREVIKVSKKYFKGLTSWMNNKKEKRVNINCTDGCRFVKAKKNYYDVILIDSTDPVDIGFVLFTKDFYRNVRKALRKNGIVVAQTEDPFYGGHLIRSINKRIRSAFGKKNTSLYLASVPTYPSGTWSFTFASRKTTPLTIRNKKTKSVRVKYYNKAVHKAAFALPEFVKELVE